MKHIHKIPFGVPRGVRAYKILVLEEIVATFYYEVKRNERSVIAYKGGHFETNVLASLAIPGVNLERFGCPKPEELMKDLVWLETCGKHSVGEAYLQLVFVRSELHDSNGFRKLLL